MSSIISLGYILPQNVPHPIPQQKFYVSNINQIYIYIYTIPITTIYIYPLYSNRSPRIFHDISPMISHRVHLAPAPPRWWRRVCPEASAHRSSDKNHHENIAISPQNPWNMMEDSLENWKLFGENGFFLS